MFDHLLDEGQQALRAEVREFVRGVPRDLILAMDRDEVDFPRDFLREAGRRNLLGVRYPTALGGRGLCWPTTCMVMEEVGALGYILACAFGVGAELVCDAIVLHGTPAQQARFVTPLLRGERFAAECLTEPTGGSDFFDTRTVAEDRGDHVVLNGQKRFIVGGTAADFFLVYARTDPDARPHEGITCLLVERGPGVETPYVYGLMGCRGGGASRVVFRDVVVPKENVLGRWNRGAAVFETMMIPERLGTAAMTIGAARPAVELATRYAARRKAFGRRIREFQGVSFQLAEAAMLLDASRALCWTTALGVEAREDPGRIRRYVSETKKLVTEQCQRAAHCAMQVMGGIGYTNVFPIERTVRDLRLASIWTGTSEVMSMIVAHEWSREVERQDASGDRRDPEPDAAEAFAADEKVFG